MSVLSKLRNVYLCCLIINSDAETENIIEAAHIGAIKSLWQEICGVHGESVIRPLPIL